MSWSKFYSEEITPAYFKRILGWLGPFVERIQKWGGGKRCLEVGFGTGVLSVYLSQQGYGVTGIDIDDELIRKAIDLNKRFNGSAVFIKQDMFKLDDNEYDFAFHQGTMEHFDADEIQKALRQQLKVCRRVIFSVPSKLHAQQDFGDERLFSYREWLDILKEFNIVESFGYHRRVNMLSRVLIPLMVLNKRLFSEISKRYLATQLGFVIEK
ncbi:MAG: class I SAM-dependent methyltransferase [Candidatus Margulisiibacteriota bacterium]